MKYSVAFASQVVGGGVFFQPEYAMAIPQTSECATNSCDGCVRDDARTRRGDARDAKSPGWIFCD